MTELHAIASCEKPARHLILIHGLGGDWKTTWGVDGDSYWPRWVAVDLPNTAVWSISYQAPQTRWRQDSMHPTEIGVSIAQVLITSAGLRHGMIAFAAHSLGGLILKHVLRQIDVQRKTSSAATSLVERTDKVIFMGTPHGGAHLATTGAAFGLITRPSAVMAALKFDSPDLRALNEWYRTFSLTSIDHLVFKETRKTRLLPFLKTQVVAPISADPGLAGVIPTPVEADHTSLCKPERREDIVYQQTLIFLQSKKEAIQDHEGVVGLVADRILNIIERKLPTLQAGAISSGMTQESTEERIAKVAQAHIGEPTLDDAVERAVLESADVAIEQMPAAERIRQLGSMRETSDVEAADGRLMSIVIQALAIAEAGYRRGDAAMMKRGLDKVDSCLSSITPEHESHLFLRGEAERLWLRFTSMRARGR